MPFPPIAESRGSAAETGPGWETLRLGPDWWLHVGPPGEPVGAGVDVGVDVDVSAQWTVLELAGPGAREVLMTGCPLDLEAYEVGRAARTLLARVPVVLHRREEDVHRLFVGSSYASYLVRWLEDAMGAP